MFLVKNNGTWSKRRASQLAALFMPSKHENSSSSTLSMSNPSSIMDTNFNSFDRATSTDSDGTDFSNNNIEKLNLLNEKRRCLSSSSCLINNINNNNSTMVSKKTSFSHKKIVIFF